MRSIDGTSLEIFSATSASVSAAAITRVISSRPSAGSTGVSRASRTIATG